MMAAKVQVGPNEGSSGICRVSISEDESNQRFQSVGKHAITQDATALANSAPVDNSQDGRNDCALNPDVFAVARIGRPQVGIRLLEFSA